MKPGWVAFARFCDIGGLSRNPRIQGSSPATSGTAMSVIHVPRCSSTSIVADICPKVSKRQHRASFAVPKRRLLNPATRLRNRIMKHHPSWETQTLQYSNDPLTRTHVRCAILRYCTIPFHAKAREFKLFRRMTKARRGRLACQRSVASRAKHSKSAGLRGCFQPNPAEALLDVVLGS